MITSRFILVLSILGLVLPALSAAPGFKATLTQRGVSYAKDVGLEVLKQKLSQITVPEITGKEHVTIIGDIDYTLSNIVITDVLLPTSVAEIEANKDVKISVSKSSAKMTLSWTYREENWPHVSGSGTADVSMSDFDITITVTLGEVTGKATVSSLVASVDVNNLSITVHGGPSWLYNLFIDIFKSYIESAANTAIANAIENEKSQLDSVIATIPISYTLEDDNVPLATLGFGLTTAPIIGSNYISLSVAGVWSTVPGGAVSPYTPTAMPTLDTTEMLEVTLVPYVFDSAIWVLWKEGKLEYTVTPADVPATSPVKLNTTNFKGYVPLLYQKYPNKGLEIKITPGTPLPLTKMNSSGITINLKIDMEVMVIVDNKTITPAFILELDVVASAKATLNNTAISINLSHVSDSATLKKSYIGTFDPTTLETVIKFLLTGVLYPYANKIANKGFDLPVVPDVKLNNPTIIYGNGYLSVASDITYVPPSSVGVY